MSEWIAPGYGQVQGGSDRQSIVPDYGQFVDRSGGTTATVEATRAQATGEAPMPFAFGTGPGSPGQLWLTVEL